MTTTENERGFFKNSASFFIIVLDRSVFKWDLIIDQLVLINVNRKSEIFEIREANWFFSIRREEQEKKKKMCSQLQRRTKTTSSEKNFQINSLTIVEYFRSFSNFTVQWWRSIFVDKSTPFQIKRCRWLTSINFRFIRHRTHRVFFVE